MRNVPIADLLVGRTNREKVQQGWSPQCEAQRAGADEWGVLKTTAIQPGEFRAVENKRLPEALTAKPQLEVNSGDLLLTCAGPRSRCGVPALVRATRPRLMLSGKIYRMRPNDQVVDSKYLELFLLSAEAQSSIDAMKTGISDSGLNLTKDRFLGLPVPLWSLAEQRRIVDILEDHLSRLDAAVATVARATAQLTTLVESTLRSTLESVHAKEVLLERILAAPLSNGRSVPTSGLGFPVLRLTALRNGRIDLNERKIGNWSRADALPFLVKADDFLVARGNGSLSLVGRGGLVGEPLDEVAFPDTMIRVRPDPSTVSAQFFAMVWNSRVIRRQIEGMARTTAGIYKINQKQLGGVRLQLPSLADQEAVVRRVSAVQHGVDRLATEAIGARNRAESLRRSLLTAAFSGKLTGAASDSDRIQDLAAAT